MHTIVNITKIITRRFAVRDGDTVKHYRIRQLDEGGFFIARRMTFRNLQDLVEHYSKDADGLCVNLCKPCVQVSWKKLSRSIVNDYTYLTLLLYYLCGLMLSEWSLDSLLHATKVYTIPIQLLLSHCRGWNIRFAASLLFLVPRIKGFHWHFVFSLCFDTLHRSTLINNTVLFNFLWQVSSSLEKAHVYFIINLCT